MAMTCTKPPRILVWLALCLVLSIAWHATRPAPSQLRRVLLPPSSSRGSSSSASPSRGANEEDAQHKNVKGLGGHYLADGQSPYAGGEGPHTGEEERKTTAAVVAALREDDVRWLDGLGWEVWKYEVDGDQREERLRVPRNKGGEAMVYLTHIIEQYDNLTDRIVFLHPKRYQWHNDNPQYDGLTMLQSLQLPYIDTAGYTSLRCHWFQGCPHALTPLENSTRPEDSLTANMALVTHLYSTAFPTFFPSLPLPATIAAPCCSQFAVSRATVLRNPRAVYVNVRNWLLDSPERDYYTGRVMEYAWHVLFGREAVSCPDAGECYCKLYGRCGLRCESRGDCGRYLYPFEVPGWRALLWKVMHVFS